MKIDRDNFRHLTGFGRDMAAYVSFAIDDVFGRGHLVAGNLQIGHNRDANTLQHRFQPFEGERDYCPAQFRTRDTLEDIQLSIISSSNGFREVTAIAIYMLNPLCSDHYHIYRHSFLPNEGMSNREIESLSYTGVTKRGWRTRWAEHLRSAENGSHYRFHKAIREWHGVAKISMHTIIGAASSEQSAMEIEEYLVERDTLYPLGLNMIPGGKSGLDYLRRIGALGKNERVSVDDRQQIINRFFDRTSRKGLPNPLAAANWLSSDYAEKVICAGEDRLKPQQIRDARFYSSLGRDADDIASQIGARNVAQVERLLSGQTYSRIT